MKDATELKGVGDLRTSITTHLRSKPRVEGEEYLHLYLAGKEKTRLEKMGHSWDKQKRRAQERHISVSNSIAKLEQKVGLETPVETGSSKESSPGDSQKPATDYTRRQWNKMSLDY